MAGSGSDMRAQEESRAEQVQGAYMEEEDTRAVWWGLHPITTFPASRTTEKWILLKRTMAVLCRDVCLILSYIE